MPPPDTDSAKRSPSADDDDHPPPKRPRTGDVVPDIDPLPINKPDYSGGRIVSMCSPFFPDLRKDLGRFLVDKTKLIEDIIDSRMHGKVDLVLRPRRCGKSTMLQMVKSFFGLPQGGIDLRHLFSGLYIAHKDEICRDHMGKYAVIFLDFQMITGTSWDDMLDSFKEMVSLLYEIWREYLWDFLDPVEQEIFQTILSKEASDATLRLSLELLSKFLAKRSGRKVIVLIDEYEALNNRAYEFNFFQQANEFFSRGVLLALLKTNEHLAYALLAGVTPTAKPGWYSGLNNIQIHALHTTYSVFAGMLMFTESEVLELRRLKESELDLEALERWYNSYLAGGRISVYNPVSIMSAFEQGKIDNFWVATGEFPFRNIPEGLSSLDIIAKLLSSKEVSFTLQDSVTFSDSTLDVDKTLTLLYYAGYLTQTTSEQFKVPNREVMMDWARWVIESTEGRKDIYKLWKKACTGPWQ